MITTTPRDKAQQLTCLPFQLLPPLAQTTHSVGYTVGLLSTVEGELSGDSTSIEAIQMLLQLMPELVAMHLELLCCYRCCCWDVIVLPLI